MGLLSVASFGLHENSTPASISSPESLLAVNRFSGGLSFKIKGSWPEWCISSMIYSRDTPFWSETLEIILTITDKKQQVLKKCWVELLWRSGSLCLPLKNTTKWLNWIKNKEKAGSRLKGRKWSFTSSTYLWLSVVLLPEEQDGNSLKRLSRLSSPAVVNPCGQLKSPAAVNRAVDFRRLEWWKG